MKTIDELIRKVDQRMIKKTGHRLTQDEIDLVRDTHAALGIIERRKTVRAKRPVQQRKHAICARGGKGHYVACRYWHSIGCSYKGKCPHKQHAVA